MFARLPNVHVVGLSGSIASGKSARCTCINDLATKTASEGYKMTVGDSFTRHFGLAQYISSDLIGHQSYNPGSDCYKGVVEAFGQGILDDSDKFKNDEFPPIDRKKLGPIVFSDPTKMQQLNGLVWPTIRGMLQDRIGEFQEKAAITESEFKDKAAAVAASSFPEGFTHSRSLLVIESALLLEMGLFDICDEVWLITVDTEEAVPRIMNRDKCDEELARKKLSSQMKSEDRISKIQSIAKERANTPRPLHVEIYDTTGMDLKQDLEVNFPHHYDALVRRMLLREQ